MMCLFLLYEIEKIGDGTWLIKRTVVSEKKPEIQQQRNGSRRQWWLALASGPTTATTAEPSCMVSS